MKQTNIEKLIELLEVEYKAISPQGWENVIKERIIRSVIEKAKYLSQEDDGLISKEKIICAAIWYKDLPNTEATYRVKNITNGIVLCGWRHSYIIGQSSALLGKKQYEMGEYVQGFLTSKGRFLDREQAAKLFVENGGKLQYSSDELFSEDLY